MNYFVHRSQSNHHNLHYYLNVKKSPKWRSRFKFAQKLVKNSITKSTGSHVQPNRHESTWLSCTLLCTLIALALYRCTSSCQLFWWPPPPPQNSERARTSPTSTTSPPTTTTTISTWGWTPTTSVAPSPRENLPTIRLFTTYGCPHNPICLCRGSGTSRSRLRRLLKSRRLSVFQLVSWRMGNLPLSTSGRRTLKASGNPLNRPSRNLRLTLQCTSWKGSSLSTANLTICLSWGIRTILCTVMPCRIFILESVGFERVEICFIDPLEIST